MHGSNRPRRGTVMIVILCAAALGAAACASGGSGHGPRRSRNVITYEELSQADVVDCSQAIQRLRPTWLQSRTGGLPGVVKNGSPQMGGISALQGIPVHEVEEMRLLPAGDATTRFGTGYVSGAILVTTRVR